MMPDYTKMPKSTLEATLKGTYSRKANAEARVQKNPNDINAKRDLNEFENTIAIITNILSGFGKK
ncbi:hypothetical protein [uncultured Brachyspira sp.]|uniref:hypothetical protein n=2 Tax=Brachyspira TaxID=29521 RepID=UPI002629C6C7|nr:hypothetical protein [uncultured Brachyspira sp.]